VKLTLVRRVVLVADAVWNVTEKAASKAAPKATATYSVRITQKSANKDAQLTRTSAP